MTTQQEQLHQLYEAYIQEASAVEANKKLGDGLLGMGEKTADHPCHMRFVKELRAAMSALKPEETNSATLREILSWIFHMANRNKAHTSIYWTLIAAQAASLEAIPFLQPDDAAALYDAYRHDFRPWNRLPLQKDILRRLDKARKAGR